MTSDTARTAFQDALRQALDTYHPRWEFGLKGKEQKAPREEFKTVACETLRDWIKGQRPQQKSFQAFLDEAEFPEDTLSVIWSLYLAFKRGRKEGSRREIELSLEQSSNRQQLVHNLATPEKPGREASARIHSTTSLIKEDMHESDRNDWLESNDRELVEISVTGMGRRAIDAALPKLAKNFSPEECADIVLAAFRKIVDNPKTREQIILWVNHYGQNRIE